MKDRLEFDEDAKLELHRAKCFFDSIGKGEQFLDDFENQIALIIKMPHAFQIRYRQVRIIGFNHFSFTIHYTIHKKEIVILNILNQYQDF